MNLACERAEADSNAQGALVSCVNLEDGSESNCSCKSHVHGEEGDINSSGAVCYGGCSKSLTLSPISKVDGTNGCLATSVILKSTLLEEISSEEELCGESIFGPPMPTGSDTDIEPIEPDTDVLMVTACTAVDESSKLGDEHKPQIDDRRESSTPEIEVIQPDTDVLMVTACSAWSEICASRNATSELEVSSTEMVEVTNTRTPGHECLSVAFEPLTPPSSAAVAGTDGSDEVATANVGPVGSESDEHKSAPKATDEPIPETAIQEQEIQDGGKLDKNADGAQTKEIDIDKSTTATKAGTGFTGCGEDNVLQCRTQTDKVGSDGLSLKDKLPISLVSTADGKLEFMKTIRDKILQDAHFFIMKSCNEENVLIAKSENLWSTHIENCRMIRRFLARKTNVILFFSVNGSHRFAGFARVVRQIHAADRNRKPVEWVEKKWLANTFEIDWISKRDLMFNHTVALRNRWNRNRPVKVGRDGQKVEPQVGAKLAMMFELNPEDDCWQKVATRLEKPAQDCKTAQWEVLSVSSSDSHHSLNQPASRGQRLVGKQPSADKVNYLQFSHSLAKLTTSTPILAPYCKGYPDRKRGLDATVSTDQDAGPILMHKRRRGQHVHDGYEFNINDQSGIYSWRDVCAWCSKHTWREVPPVPPMPFPPPAPFDFFPPPPEHLKRTAYDYCHTIDTFRFGASHHPPY